MHARDIGLPLALQVLITPGAAAHADTASHRLFANGFLLESTTIAWFFDQYLPPGQRCDWRFAPLLAEVDGVGQFIGLVNDRLNVVSDSLTGCVGEALATVVSDRHELITVFAGLDVPDELAETVGQSIAETYPSCEIDSVRGDQPHYRLIISVE